MALQEGLGLNLSGKICFTTRLMSAEGHGTHLCGCGQRGEEATIRKDNFSVLRVEHLVNFFDISRTKSVNFPAQTKHKIFTQLFSRANEKHKN